MRQPICLARLAATAAVATILAVGLSGCKTAGMSDVTGSVGGRTATPQAPDPAQGVEAYGERFRANPRDPEAGLRYGQALRANGQRQQAVAVFEQATLNNPGHKALMAGYGRALADTGAFQRAFDVLASAHTPANPDWRILSVQGAVLDQMGRHDEARGYYDNALKIRPEDPSVLSNLGLSYMLSKDLPRAESTLRRAYGAGGSDPRVRQNLGLVVGLQGRFGEAETIVKADLPPEEAAANVAYLKQMLSKSPQGGAAGAGVRERS
jgi:Flp pilus assembly protein TadD